MFANLIGSIAAMAEDMFTVYEVLRGAEYGPLGHGLGWDPAGFAVISFGLHRFCLDCCDCLFDLFAYPGHPNRGSALAESNTRARRNLLPG